MPLNTAASQLCRQQECVWRIKNITGRLKQTEESSMGIGRLAIGIVASVLTIASSAWADQWISFTGKEGPGKGKNIVLMAGDDEYRSEEGLPQLAKILAEHHGFNCRVVFSIDPKTGMIDPNTHTNTPGLEALDNADLLIMLTRFRNLPDEQMEHFVKYLNDGKPIIGLRTATHGFEIKDKESKYAKYDYNSKVDGWKGGFGKTILGETWVGHHGDHMKQSTRGIVVPDAKDNPILRGVDDVWTTTDVYAVRFPMSPDVHVLVLGQVLSGMHPTDSPLPGKKNEPMMPIAWTKEYKSESGKVGRTFTTTIGAALDLENEGLRRMIVNATYWCAGMESQIPAKADVDIVGEFKPTKDGFNGFKKNHKPEDYAGNTWPKSE
jgi:hypothetical protein